jgi:WD40 repeat protein
MRVWDVRRRALTRFRSQVAAAALAFSSDGRLIAVASGNHRGADIRDARSGRLVKFVRTGELARSVAFSPDGDLLVIGLYDGGLEFFSTGDWKRIGRRIEAHSAGITHPVFTPDGRTLATAGADGTVALWNVDTQNPIGTPVTVDPGTATSAAFSPDGSKLFAVSTSGQGVRLNTSAEAWKRHACLVAGRELTPAEWDDALPGRRYQAVCSDD